MLPCTLPGTRNGSQCALLPPPFYADVSHCTVTVCSTLFHRRSLVVMPCLVLPGVFAAFGPQPSCSSAAAAAQLPLASRLDTALDMLLGVQTLHTFGASAPSDVLAMATAPKVLAWAGQPPASVTVAQLIEVLVYVGLSPSAPLPNVLVTLTMTPASLGALTQSVDAWVSTCGVKGRCPLSVSQGWQRR
jgi:hypothetical protein